MNWLKSLVVIALLATALPVTNAGSGPGRQSDSACGLAGAANCGSVTVDGTADCVWIDRATNLARCQVSITGTVLATNWVSPGRVSASMSGYKCYEQGSTSWIALSGILTFSCSHTTEIYTPSGCPWWNTRISASFTGTGSVPRDLFAEGGPRSCAV